MSKKIGVKFKQREPDASSSSGGEMEGVEGVVRSLVPGLCIDGHGNDKDTFGPVGVRFLKRMEPGLLAEVSGFRLGPSWEVSGCVEMMVGAVESVKVTRSGLVMFVYVPSDQREQPFLWDTSWGRTSILLYA